MEDIHVLIGTPMYGGMCHRGFVESLLRLQQLCLGLGIKITHKFLSNESLITRGRNLINAIFMSNPSYTHLLFIDSDISFRHDAIIRMIQADLDISGLQLYGLSQQAHAGFHVAQIGSVVEPEQRE
jgi:hypothetical protein